LVLSPLEPLVAGGAAEALERQLQQLFRGGQRHVIVDLGGVTAIDSAGIRALVRGHTTALRLGTRLRLAAAPPTVKTVLDLAHLGDVFDIYESVDAARVASWPWQTIRIVAAGAVLCSALVWAGLQWPLELTGLGEGAAALVSGGKNIPIHEFRPFIELLKLIVATLIGLLVTSLHQPSIRERPHSMEQAQTLLCVSGAMTMIVIGDSLARAFGIAGAFSLIRFKTPIDDPKDVTILFLLMGLGMSAGLGAFAVAGLGTAFLCTVLLLLDQVTPQRARMMSVEILADGRQFPTTHVEGVFARNEIVFEPREISTADDVSVKYLTWLAPRTSIDDISLQLMNEHTGVKSVTWEHPKRER
jgi:anti-anti-sigma factor